MRFALPALLLLAAACVAPPTRAEVGGLTIDNQMRRPVGFSVAWHDPEQGHYGYLEGLLPAAGAHVQIRQGGDLPKGVTLRFAVYGAGFGALLERNEVGLGDFLPSVIRNDTVEIYSGATAFLRRTVTSEQEEGMAGLDPAQQSWVYAGGEVHLVLVDDGYGGIRISER